MLLKPLPYEHGDRLVVRAAVAPLSGQPNFGVSIKELYDYREQRSTCFDGLVEFHQMNFDLLDRGEPDRVAPASSRRTSSTCSASSRCSAARSSSDDDEGAEAVLVLSHTYWQPQFGGDPNIVGQVFEMNDRPHTVVGVLPTCRTIRRKNDVYMPVLRVPVPGAGERHDRQNRRAFGALQRVRPAEAGRRGRAGGEPVATIVASASRRTPAASIGPARLPGHRPTCSTR